MSRQLGLQFSERRYRLLTLRLDRLLASLSDGRWKKAAELMRELHISDRSVRQLADFSDGRVVSTDKGYCLLRYATVDEIYEAQGRLTSQAKKMLERAAQYQKELNKRSVAA